MKYIVVFGTFDTKGEEYHYLISRIRAFFDGEITTIDVAGMPYEPSFIPTISNIDVAQRAGCSKEDLRRADRLKGVEIMIEGLKRVLAELRMKKKMDGVIALGGGAGTIMGLEAMRSLPVGFPKIMVSTIATSAKVGAYVEGRDIMVMNSIVDISGLNKISRRVFDMAAGAIVGAVQNSCSEMDFADSKPVIAASMFGNTTPGVSAAKDWLERQGYEVLVFHANGGGGRTMESLIREGMITGVLDLTTTEWADNVCDGTVCKGGSGRLDAAAQCGVPQVVAPGALDQANYGSREGIPEKYAHRNIYGEGRSCLMRTDMEENIQMGKAIADKLNQCIKPCVFLFPNKGFSKLDMEGGPFYGPEENRAFHDTLLSHLHNKNVTVQELDNHINDEEFGIAAARRLHTLIQSAGQ